MVCYKKLFCKEGILNNIGCYILFVIILFHIATFFIFILKLFPSIKERIKNIVKEIQSAKENKKGELNDELKKAEKYINDIYIYKNVKKRRNRKKHIVKKKSMNDSKTKLDLKYEKKTHDKGKKIENITNFIDEEINEFSYYLAIQYDKRSFCQYYFSLIKTQHSLISAIFNYNDYNSIIIKIDLFIIGFAIEYAVNGLFYDDDTMHKIYENKGQFDFETQLPIIVYSTFISIIFNTPLNFLALSNDAIIGLKQDNTKLQIRRKAKNLKHILTIKFIFYFIIGFLFLIFFWYYISMFGAIYKNTQIHLLKDSLMSFGLSLLFPFGIFLLPGLFRIPALSNPKKKRKCLYNFSKLLQSI